VTQAGNAGEAGALRTSPEPQTMTMVQALNEGLRAAMNADPAVVILGEDVGRLGGVFRVTDGLQAEFGPERVLDTPLAEAGIVGSAIGLAMRARWLVRAQAVPPARTWIEGAAVLTYVGAAVCADTQISLAVLSDLDRAAPGLAAARGGEHDLPSFRARLPPWLRDWLPEPVLADDADPDQALWLAWGAWWRRIEAEGVALLRSGGFGPEPVIGAVAVLSADAWRVRAALSAAAYGVGSGDGKALETFDALA